MNVRDAIREHCREATNSCRHNKRRRRDSGSNEDEDDDEFDADDTDKVLCQCVLDMHVTPNQVSCVPVRIVDSCV
jgi:hypothetical protein